MTTPVKQYQNVSFKELITYSENNPNRDRTLDSIEIQSLKSVVEDKSLSNIGLTNYTACNLNPTGVMSLLACIEDPMNYSLSTKNARLHNIIEVTTELQHQTDTLKNTVLSRKRRRINELISASYNGCIFEDKDCLELFSGISFMQNCHFILIKSAVQETIEEGQYTSSLKGEILFSSDPSTWKRENQVWIVDYRARWVAVPTDNNNTDIHFILGNWLSTAEQSGWVVHWPQYDGTKVELLDKLSTLPTWKETDRKLTKDILGARLGRASCIKVFSQWA